VRLHRRKSDATAEETEVTERRADRQPLASKRLDASAIMALGKKVADMPLISSRTPQEILDGIGD
jgi:hypothetical protein